ncbi:cytochrome bb3 quinol oxidase subunit 4 [Sphingomonas gellani]|uniref:Cytochrome bo(3) ubiquinol oxidase subunit 4 n=1 Tax=Sphingomonas gellani TaxID=1166340 RepID=A0A1H8DPB0_9SPHN|nr:cytochrome o ubiquinol oxidase subunit IV [Sphingomonas gellani]SEN09070.1 cytochrome bb3 quinol oxidase subunit 4 [Sphingomonas gellani]
MSEDARDDAAPGETRESKRTEARGVGGYVVGLALATLLTAASFLLPGSGLVWGPAVPAALVVLAVAQMGVHLVFFLHISTGPDNTNNVIALAFGVLVVLLVVLGSVWIMTHLNHQLMTPGDMARMMR